MIKRLKKVLPIILSLLVFVGCDKKTKTNQKPSSIRKMVLNDGVYRLDTQKSKLSWVGKELSTEKHTGTLNLAGGKIK